MSLLTVVELLLLVLALVDVITRDSSQVRHLPKVAWILLVVLVPIAGSVIWFVAGHDWQPAPRSHGRYAEPTRHEDRSATLDEARADRGHRRVTATEQELQALEDEIQYWAQRSQGQRASDPPTAAPGEPASTAEQHIQKRTKDAAQDDGVAPVWRAANGDGSSTAYPWQVAHLLGAEDLRLEYPTRVIFDGVSIGIDEGDRIGVVGRNGDGKSTLMSLLAQRIEPDGGRVTQRRGITVGFLDQRDELPAGMTVGSVVVGDRAEYEWAGDARIRDVISGLVSDIDWNGLVDDLSGGQRRRVALARLLVGDWDVLFLDEPTNHLDVEGIAWLAEHCKRRWSGNAGGLVVVTHDRWFLDEVSTTTWEVHDGIVDPFEGGYAAYVLQRVERDRMASASESRRQNLMRKELAWLRRGAPARSTKPKFRIDAANELIENEPPVRDAVALSQMATSRLGKDVVDVLDAGVSFGDGPDAHTVLEHIEWRIAPGERTGILGPNGAGKSTLLGLVSGTLQPTSGKVKTGKTVQIAMLDQQLADLHQFANDRVREVVARKKTTYIADGKEMTPSQLLERLGFSSAQLSTQVKDLSGGQKRRLQLMLILLDEPNVLILDEPTNDLDTDMLAAMEDLLDSWPGCLIVVSHDRYLLERVTDQQYAILDARLRHLPGGVEEYMRLRSAGSSAPKDAAAATARVAAAAVGSYGAGGSAGAGGPGGVGGGASGSGASGSGGRGGGAGASGAASARVLSGAERRTTEKELSALERRIARLGVERQTILDGFADHDQGDSAGLGSLQARLAQIDEELETLESRWLAVAELLGV